MSLVSSHNEWDPLEEVIIGNGFPESLPLLEYSFRLFFHDNLSSGKDYQVGDTCISKRHVCEHQEDLEEFVSLLQSLGVAVKRPKVPKRLYKVRTPGWESTIHPALNVRDMAMIIGDTIIESSPTIRYRYFENFLLSHLFLEYFKGGCKWLQSPKPIMTDSSFDLAYIDESTGVEDRINSFRPRSHELDCGHEIMFDAANCMRLGTHILMNVANDNQRLGAEWLQKALSDKYTIWTTGMTDSHIDSSFLPLRPGLALIMRPIVRELLPKPLQKWDLIHIPMRDRTQDQMDSQGIKLASPRIELNVLSVSPNLIICHPEYEKVLNERLKKYKIEAIGTPFRHCEIFSGAHHCTSLDIRRRGVLENYFDE